jgi:rare lipoprotein A (peptidoglycan hydrolase)
VTTELSGWPELVVRAAHPTPEPSAGSSPQGASGIASWYATGPDGLYAAAGPALRVGAWRGRVVTVCATVCIRVRLIDWCACRGRLIDLSDESFSRLAPLSRGLVRVEVRW